MKTQILFVIMMLFGLSQSFAQNREIYTNPDFTTVAKDHKELAILPFKAIIKLRPKQMEKFTPEEFQKLQEDEGKGVQSALQSYFLKRKGQKGFTVSFQDINKTNALLAKNNISAENIDQYTAEELAKLLQVDGIVSGTLNTEKPMSEGASLALGLLVGYYGTTNSGKCTININDGATGALLWKYEKTLSRSLGSDTNTMIDAMMRKASRKFPYAEI